MKVNVFIEREIEYDIKILEMEVCLDHGGSIPKDLPFKRGDMWNPTIDIDEGSITCWPKGKSFKIDAKVCDRGSYRLYIVDPDNGDYVQVSSIENDYVPNGLVPGAWGDYIEMEIDSDGKILNWPEKPNFDEFTF